MADHASKGLRLENITKIYNSYNSKNETFKAVDDISLTVEAGEFITLLGPSGCGKSTTLRMVAGFEVPDAGEIYIGDKPMKNLTPDKRNTAMVFQSYALFPHLNVYDNIAYGLKVAHMSKDEIAKKVNEMLDLVGLHDLGRRTPGQLSGGQQQRVALARALVMQPDLLLFDEPLSNLDAKLRVYMRTEIKRIQQSFGVTALYVTHDQAEAMSLSDRIIIMNKGIIAQMGTPQEIYYRPHTRFVAEFIGSANFLKCKLLEDKGDYCDVDLSGQTMQISKKPGLALEDTCTLVLRPESIQLGEKGRLQGKVTRSTFMGNCQEYDLNIHLSDGESSLFVEDYNPFGHKIYGVGETVWVDFDEQNLHIVK